MARVEFADHEWVDVTTHEVSNGRVCFCVNCRILLKGKVRPPSPYPTPCAYGEDDDAERVNRKIRAGEL